MAVPGRGRAGRLVRVPRAARLVRTAAPCPGSRLARVIVAAAPLQGSLWGMAGPDVIRTPDQRVRVFVSSTLSELAAERQAVQDAVSRLRLVPVLFELGARPYPPRPVYRAYLAQSQVFVGIYWQSYGWVAPGEQVSGLEDEYQLSAGLPRLLYVKGPAPDREPRLAQLLAKIQDEGGVSYQHFSDPAGLQQLVENDLAVLLSERFELTRPGRAGPPAGRRWPGRFRCRPRRCWAASRRPLRSRTWSCGRGCGW